MIITLKYILVRVGTKFVCRSGQHTRDQINISYLDTTSFRNGGSTR